jgi:taurine dioxygenase
MTEIRPLTSRFGAELVGLNLRHMTEAQRDMLRAALARFGLLLFRDQALDDADLYRFSCAMGDGRLEASARSVSHAARLREVAYLTNLKLEDGSPFGFGGNTTDYWHSDQEFREHPATLATLYCLIPSPVGGGTSFASTRVGCLGLDEVMLARLRALWSTRRPAANHDNARHVEVAHPVVSRNPLTGTESIYVSENAIRFLGVEAAEGAALKSYLMARILCPENIYSHSWQMGDLVIYDNTQLLHRREAFEGPRWLKATKIFPSALHFHVMSGRVEAA